MKVCEPKITYGDDDVEYPRSENAFISLAGDMIVANQSILPSANDCSDI